MRTASSVTASRSSRPESGRLGSSRALQAADERRLRRASRGRTGARARAPRRRRRPVSAIALARFLRKSGPVRVEIGPGRLGAPSGVDLRQQVEERMGEQALERGARRRCRARRQRSKAASGRPAPPARREPRARLAGGWPSTARLLGRAVGGQAFAVAPDDGPVAPEGGRLDRRIPQAVCDEIVPAAILAAASASRSRRRSGARRRGSSRHRGAGDARPPPPCAARRAPRRPRRSPRPSCGSRRTAAVRPVRAGASGMSFGSCWPPGATRRVRQEHDRRLEAFARVDGQHPDALAFRLEVALDLRLVRLDLGEEPGERRRFAAARERARGRGTRRSGRAASSPSRAISALRPPSSPSRRA